jgi:hypothetical protein
MVITRSINGERNTSKRNGGYGGRIPVPPKKDWTDRGQYGLPDAATSFPLSVGGWSKEDGERFRGETLATRAAWEMPAPTLDPLTPLIDNGGGGRGRRGGGGGGGGGGGDIDAKAAALAEQNGFLAMLKSKMFQTGSIDDDLAKVGTAVDADRAYADSQYGGLNTFLQGQKNAYGGERVAQSAQLSPELLQLLSMSGGDTRAYQGQVGLANQMNAQATASGQRLNDRMAQVSAEAKTSRLAESEQARIFAGQELGSQKVALEEGLRARQKADQTRLTDQRTEVIMKLISAMAMSGQPVDISQYLGGA